MPTSPFVPLPTPLPGAVSQPELPAAQLWRLFAPALAGRLQIRTFTARSRYRAAGRLDPERLPTDPAAVLLYDTRGRARCLALDLDSKTSSRSQVLIDSHRAVGLAAAAGLPAIVDESPNGGRHVYLPLAHSISATEALETASALRSLLPSLDTAPLANRSTGAIRPPGSAHPAGGHQRLITGVEEAIAAVYVPGGPDQWKSFVRALPRHSRGDATIRPPGQLSVVPDAPGRPALDPWADILRTGTFDHTIYPTPSEARFAALCHLLRRGWTAADITTAAVDGRFPGLLTLFAKHRQRVAALTADLQRAVTKLTTCFDRPLLPNAPHKGPPTPPRSPGGSPALERLDSYAFLRSWWTAARHEGRVRKGTGLVDRSVLQALGALAQMRGSRHLDVGCRALAQAACLDHSTVARSLKRLASEPDPFLVLLQASADTDGSAGDLYELVIPTRHAARALGDPWAPGLIERIHPAFWVLSHSSRYVWAALTQRARSESELRRDAGLARQTCRDALAELVAYGLARQVGRAWQLGHTTLNQVARRNGGDTKAAEVQARHLSERRAWRVLKRLPPPAPDRAQPPVPTAAVPAAMWWEDGTPLPPEPVDQDPRSFPGSLEAALALLHDLLGAVVLTG